mmetsp:Transcript_31545/g.79036  ORF Transcript_31545/g.79036 Transcript_31545/m.79036 type:complete len:239 (-) Transcript_31545:19-735(-)
MMSAWLRPSWRKRPRTVNNVWCPCIRSLPGESGRPATHICATPLNRDVANSMPSPLFRGREGAQGLLDSSQRGCGRHIIGDDPCRKSDGLGATGSTDDAATYCLPSAGCTLVCCQAASASFEPGRQDDCRALPGSAATVAMTSQGQGGNPLKLRTIRRGLIFAAKWLRVQVALRRLTRGTGLLCPTPVENDLAGPYSSRIRFRKDTRMLPPVARDQRLWRSLPLTGLTAGLYEYSCGV